MNLSRRNFIVGAVSSAATDMVGCERQKSKGLVRIDPNRVVLAADVHIPILRSEQKYRTGREFPWVVDLVRENIDEILRLDPLPANFIVLGDLSAMFSEEKEYVILRELLQPLRERGIKVTLTMGNHDTRAVFAKAFPECAAQSLVPGRYAYRVETPFVDFLVLDSLKEPPQEKHRDRSGYGLGEEQTAWAKKALSDLKKPTFVCAHHHVNQIEIKTEVVNTPKVVGYVHGHHHQWQTDRIITTWTDDARTLRTVGLGAFGLDGDIGYAIMDVNPEAATLKVIAKDYFFPLPQPKERRPKLWDELVRDHQGRRFVFPLS